MDEGEERGEGVDGLGEGGRCPFADFFPEEALVALEGAIAPDSRSVRGRFSRRKKERT